MFLFLCVIANCHFPYSSLIYETIDTFFNSEMFSNLLFSYMYQLRWTPQETALNISRHEIVMLGIMVIRTTSYDVDRSLISYVQIFMLTI